MTDRLERAEAQLRSLLHHPIDVRKRAYFIESNPTGRRLVITDIHGCYQTFCKMLKKVKLKKKDQLFILGDMVNRGPYSLLVLEKIWDLLATGYKVYPLRGNHEQLLLSYNREKTDELSTFAGRQCSSHLLTPSGYLLPSLDRFLSLLPIYFETEKELMVHAGFNTSEKNPFEHWKDMIWIRSFRYDERKLKGKRILHGHVPKEVEVIKRNLMMGEKDIDLDSGCVKAEVPGYGVLLCLDLDTHRIYSKKNVDVVPF